MLTFTCLGDQTVRCTGGPMPVLAFPGDPEKGAINLFAAPQEFPSRELISWPGEYDVAGITIRGLGQEEGRQVSYTVDIDHTRIAFPSVPLLPWPAADIERMGDVHVLVLPAEDPKVCQDLLDEVDPRILIIVPGSKGTINPEVLKVCGAAGKEVVKEYKLKGALPQEGREVVVFGK